MSSANTSQLVLLARLGEPWLSVPVTNECVKLLFRPHRQEMKFVPQVNPNLLTQGVQRGGEGSRKRKDRWVQRNTELGIKSRMKSRIDDGSCIFPYKETERGYSPFRKQGSPTVAQCVSLKEARLLILSPYTAMGFHFVVLPQPC